MKAVAAAFVALFILWVVDVNLNGARYTAAVMQPAMRDGPPDEGALTAKTDDCLLSSVAEHFGHASFVDSRTNNSN